MEPTARGKAHTPRWLASLRDAFVQALHDYKSDKRNNAIMKSFVGTLSDQDMANLAAYYASLKVK